MKCTQRATIVVLSAATYTSNVHATNFLIFQPDDMRFYEDWSPPAHLPWPRSYPGEEYPMYSNLPWINKLRNNGMVMNNAYTSSPMCGTSRYSTITGRYPTRSSVSRVTSWRDGTNPANAIIPNTKLEDIDDIKDGNDCSHGNIAQVFRKNGYTTGMVGKWHLTDTLGRRRIEKIRRKIISCGFDKVEA